jgi:hypothetical protein
MEWLVLIHREPREPQARQDSGDGVIFQCGTKVLEEFAAITF